MAELGTGIVCSRRAVADDVARWLDSRPVPRSRPLALGWFHLGSDFAPAVSAAEADTLPAELAAALARRPTVLLVGTLEPRKGHAQAVAASDAVRRAGTDLVIVIVGQPGWGVDGLIERLRGRSGPDGRLFWLEGAGDAALERLYRSATVMLMASEGEGFGLPPIEAAHRGLPVIARDLPVFREVAGEHARTFSGTDPDDLAAALRARLAPHAAGRAPGSTGMRHLSCEGSTRQLRDVVLADRWYRTWPPFAPPTP